MMDVCRHTMLECTWAAGIPPHSDIFHLFPFLVAISVKAFDPSVLISFLFSEKHNIILLSL